MALPDQAASEALEVRAGQAERVGNIRRAQPQRLLVAVLVGRVLLVEEALPGMAIKRAMRPGMELVAAVVRFITLVVLTPMVVTGRLEFALWSGEHEEIWTGA